MTSAEATAIDNDLAASIDLRANRMWQRHILPWAERVRAEHRAGMSDRTLPPEARCEHVTGWEIAQEFLELLDAQETLLRTELAAHDDAADIIDRPFR